MVKTERSSSVDNVIFEGFKDEEENRYQELYKKWLAENSSKLKKGKAD